MRVVDHGVERDLTPIERFAVAMVTVGACVRVQLDIETEADADADEGVRTDVVPYRVIGARMGMTHERARQIYVRVMRRLQAACDADQLPAPASERPPEHRKRGPRGNGGFSLDAIESLIVKHPGSTTTDLTRHALKRDNDRRTIHQQCWELVRRGRARRVMDLRLNRRNGTAGKLELMITWHPPHEEQSEAAE